jgi:hypothetical protein
MEKTKSPEGIKPSLPKAPEVPTNSWSRMTTRAFRSPVPPTAHRFAIFPTSRELPELLSRPCSHHRRLPRFLHGVPQARRIILRFVGPGGPMRQNDPRSLWVGDAGRSLPRFHILFTNLKKQLTPVSLHSSCRVRRNYSLCWS